MYHIPLHPVQKRCLDTCMREKQLPNFPVKQISQVMRNKGLFLGLYPETVSDIIHAIHQEGCITYWMFRSYIATNYYYQLSLCLRHEAELYRWVWLGPGGVLGSGYFFAYLVFLTLSFSGGRILCSLSSGSWILWKKALQRSVLLSFNVGRSMVLRASSYDKRGHRILQALLWISSMLSVSSWVRPGCHTGVAYTQ